MAQPADPPGRDRLAAPSQGDHAMTPREISSRDWFGKLSAALVLGFTLALALTCAFQTLFSRGDAYFSPQGPIAMRSDEHTSELQSLMRSSYAVFSLQKKNQKTQLH